MPLLGAKLQEVYSGLSGHTKQGMLAIERGEDRRGLSAHHLGQP